MCMSPNKNVPVCDRHPTYFIYSLKYRKCMEKPSIFTALLREVNRNDSFAVLSRFCTAEKQNKKSACRIYIPKSFWLEPGIFYLA